jgi:FkbM family methyltransferase
MGTAIIQRANRNCGEASHAVGHLLRVWQRLYRWVPNVRGKGRVLWHWPARLIRNWPTDVSITSLDGCTFLHCDLTDYLYQKLFFWGVYESDVDWMCRRLLKPADVFIDIGASYGYHALTSARIVGPQGRVYAFEPQPTLLAALLENLRINDLANVKAEGFALNDRPEELRLHRFAGLGMGHTSVALLEHRPSETLCCAATTMDSYVAREGIKRVALVKLDVEGSELKILRGSLGLLGELAPPMWIIEVNITSASACGYHPRDLLSLLAGFGYKAFCPIWGKATRKVRGVEPCSAEQIKDGQNLLYAIPSIHSDALARVGAV